MAHFLGDSNDYDHYTGANALRKAVEEGAVRMKETFEIGLSSLENLTEFVENVLLPKGMKAVAESLNDEVSQEEAENNMADAIDAHVAGVQEDLLKHYQTHCDQYSQYVARLNEHEVAEGSDVLWAYRGTREEFEDDVAAGDLYVSELDYLGDEYSVDVELADGSTYNVSVPEYSQSGSNSGMTVYPDFVDLNSDLSPDGALYSFVGFYSQTEDGEPIFEDIDESNIVLEMGRYDSAFDELAAARNSVYGELNELVTDMYAHYDPGDIDLGDVVDPTTAYLEFKNKVDDEAFAGATAAGMLGIPRTEEPMDIRLESDGIEVTGSIYSTEAPDGGFDVGSTYDPDSLDFAVMMRYTSITEDENGEATEETDFTEINQPFTILEATDSDGNEVDTVEPEPSSEYDPADIESIQEQLEQIREEQRRMQREAGVDDGLFGFPSFGLGDADGGMLVGLAVLLLTVVTVVAAVLSNALPFLGE